MDAGAGPVAPAPVTSGTVELFRFVLTGLFASILGLFILVLHAAAWRCQRGNGEVAIGDGRGHAVRQRHGADVLRVDTGAPADRSQMAKADGLVTTEPGLGLSILTADCLPLLLAEAGGKVVGACHAGWRGAARGIVDATVRAMRDAGARNWAETRPGRSKRHFSPLSGVKHVAAASRIGNAT